MGLITIDGLPIEQSSSSLLGNEPLLIFSGGETRQIALSSVASSTGTGIENNFNKYSFIGGGCLNVMEYQKNSSIIGGFCNRLGLPGNEIFSNECSNNNILGTRTSSISGGTNNMLINASNSVISGGGQNLIQNTLDANIEFQLANPYGNIILGGRGPNINGYKFNLAIGTTLGRIGGCTGNITSNSNYNSYNTNIGGYRQTIVNQRMSTVISSRVSVISGLGMYNTILGATYGCIINTNKDANSNTNILVSNNIIGGTSNTITGDKYSSIINGRSNTVKTGSNKYSSILNGKNNNALSAFSFIASGSGNEVRAENSSIIGGKNNRVLQSHCDSSIIGTNITSVSGNMLHANTLYLSADALPKSDPGIKGVIFLSGGLLDAGLGASVLMISNG